MNQGLYNTASTPLAAALCTLGVPLASDAKPVSNVYDEKHPRKKDTRGEWLPGVVTYHMGAVSTIWNDGKGNHVSSALLAESFNDDPGINENFGALLTELAEKDAAFAKRFTIALVRFLMQFLFIFLRNFGTYAAYWKKARPMLRVNRTDGTFAIVPLDCDEETKRHFNI